MNAAAPRASGGSRRTHVHQAHLEEPFDDEDDAFVRFERREDPLKLLADAVKTQSSRALAMAREAGLETP